MFEVRKGLRVLLLSVLIACGYTSSPAWQGDPVRLSDFIGDTLDRREQDLYELGFDDEDFRWATFTIGPDSMLDALVSSQGPFDQVPVLRTAPRYRRYDEMMEHIRDKERDFLAGRQAGSTVRVSMKSGSTVEGKLVAVRDSVLLVRTAGGVRDDLVQIDRSTVTGCFLPGGSNVGSGLSIGLLSGVSLGIVVGLADGDDPPGWLSFSAGGKAAFGAFVLGSVGALVGTVAGAVSGEDDEIVDHTDTHGMRMLSKYPLGEPSPPK